MAHKLLEVINVGQGDCLILRPNGPNGCTYSGQALIIDTGNGICDFTNNLDNGEDYHVILTHSHSDHVNGFNLLLGSKFANMKSLILPHYHDESVLIARALLNLKGMASLSDTWGLKRQLTQAVLNQRTLINLGQRIKISFVRDGDRICNHISILNPPLMWTDSFQKVHDDIIQAFADLFEDNFGEELSTYLRMASNNATTADSPRINEFMLLSHERKDLQNRANFVLEYLFDNLLLMRSFNEHPTERELLNLIKKKELKDHQACIVMRCCYKGKWFLFGGDADKSVWNRLIREKKDISAHYLKVPHHGSKHNITQRILKKIKPTIAIISHNNGLFGKATDPHPNEEVLDWINEDNIQLISTNDIKKHGEIIWDCNRKNAKDPDIETFNI